MMITVIAPEHDEGIVGMRAGFQRIQYTADHGIRITYTGEVAMDRVIHGLQRLQLFMDSGAVGPNLLNISW